MLLYYYKKRIYCICKHNSCESVIINDQGNLCKQIHKTNHNVQQKKVSKNNLQNKILFRHAHEVRDQGPPRVYAHLTDGPLIQRSIEP